MQLLRQIQLHTEHLQLEAEKWIYLDVKGKLETAI